MRYTIFGESHGPAIGVVIEGVPAGLAVDWQQVSAELARRAPGKNLLSTSRREADEPEILSGIYNGKTTGTPICIVIRNQNAHSADYAKTGMLARPGHADYTGYVQSGGCSDPRGGGHFSGRLTAPLVAAGAIAKQILAARGICIAAHIASVADIPDAMPDMAAPDMEKFLEVSRREFPVFDEEAGAKMQQAILRAREEMDSVGGVIECFVSGIPAGKGAPDYGKNVEGIFAQQMFAVPAVKAIGFGDGFAIAQMRGSEANDAFYNDNGTIKTKTNHSGGINGGITNGMPIVCRVAIRPTPSIARPQQTVDLLSGEDGVIEIKGRHDPCIVHRAVPVIEAAAALACCELLEV